MIVDGRMLAEAVLARTSARGAAPVVVGYVSEDPSTTTKSYLRIKERSAERAGCTFIERSTHKPLNEGEMGIVQFPTTLSQEEIDALLPITKDPDVLSRAAREKFTTGDPEALLPPVVGAVREILKAHHVEIKGKRAVVVGAGFLVGAPAATWLAQQGAEVTVVTLETNQEDVVAALGAADIIVSGAGSPHFITPDMIKDGVVLIDAGTSESSGKVVGDADPACAEKCTLFTPVPGGVGPIAVALLFENATILKERNL